METIETIPVTREQSGVRLDKFLSEASPDKSRNYFANLLKNGAVMVNQSPAKASYKVQENDTIEIHHPEAVEVPILPENIPLDILYEDDDVLIVNKPKGMVVHPAPGHTTGTLVNAILYYCGDTLSGINGEKRPGIVHRIDQDTTGALLVCKTDFAHRDLAEQIKAHTVTRRYVGFVAGNVKEDSGTIESTIGRHPIDRKKMAMHVKNGKNAITHYNVLERFPSGVATFMEFTLETGRTHQIRVHMAGQHHPLLGDPLYGSGKNPYHLEGQALHAAILGFTHPRTGEYIEVSAPYPDYFETLFRRFR